MTENFSSKGLKPVVQCGLILLIMVILVLAGCKKKDTTSENQPPNNNQQPAITAVGTPVGSPVSKGIGAAGGSLVSSDGKIELQVPAGALVGTTNISIQPITNMAPGGIGLAYSLLPTGTKFSKPATIRFHYTDQDVADNLPYLFWIAYQDSLGRWMADRKNRDFDSVARTVSLDISHFTDYAFGEEFHALAQPDRLKKNETATVYVYETTITGETQQGLLTSTTAVPSNLIDFWTINGEIQGNSVDGTINRVGDHLVYTAPASIDRERREHIIALLNVSETIFDHGIAVGQVRNLTVSTHIYLIPSEYNYQVKILQVDSTICPWWGIIAGTPVYKDTAQFDLNIKMGNTVTSTVSNIRNGPPHVVPASFTFQGVQFSWLADPFGEMNITDVQATGARQQDSVLIFGIIHTSAMTPGFILGSSNTPPAAFEGIPRILELDLKRGAYTVDKGFGSHTIFIITPR